MRVLLTADTVGGVWTYTLELVRASPGTEFLIASMGGLPTAAQRAAMECLPNATLRSSEWKLEWMDDPWPDLARSGAWLLDLESDWAPDLIHLNEYSHAALPFQAPKLVVGHSCVLSWWQAVKGEPAPAAYRSYRQMVERGLCAADMVIAPSAWMLDALRQHYRFPGPTRFIHNGCSQPGAPVRPGGRRTIFAAGRLWDEAKNLSAVVKAAPQWTWPVRIAGAGGSDSTNVQHLGVLDAAGMADAYRSAGIYLFPALYEPFGLSVLEAALSGCALVLGDIPSLREVWGDAALYVPPRDHQRIVEAVEALIEDEDSLQALARPAFERARRYSAARMADEYARAYQSLVPRYRQTFSGRPAAEVRP
ncbi:MAG: glycosyltransferase [Acidobacteria bacterium]|nr:glycosyltransferase [Acidobacteriota bacterium]